jgi:hypothetical protein
MKEIKVTKPMAAAALAVVMAQAAEQAIRPVVEGYRQKIIEEEFYDYDEKWIKRGLVDVKDYIKSFKDDYMMDAKEYKHYWGRCRKEQEKAGLKTAKPEHCPLLVAENTLSDAKRLLVDVMEPVTKISYDDLITSKNAIKNLNELVELTLRLICNTKTFKQINLRVNGSL